MDATKSDDGKIQSMEIIKKCIIEPTEEVLKFPFSSTDELFMNINGVLFYLRGSERQLAFLKKELESHKYDDDKLKVEIQEVICMLEKNIHCLKERFNLYKKSIEEQNKKMNFSVIKKLCSDPKLYESLINEILVVYEEPANNETYGKMIRDFLMDLETFESPRDAIALSQLANECELMMKDVEELQKSCNESAVLQIEKQDFMKVHGSLQKLLKLCRIVNSNLREQIE